VEVATVIPCYREPFDLVLAAVRSAQSVPGMTRVIVVDDGGHDPALDALPCEVIHAPTNGGPSAALDIGIRQLSEESIICRLDVRDAFYPEAKGRQIETVKAGVRASVSAHYDPVPQEEYVPPADWRKRMYRDSCFSSISMAIHHSVWREIGIDASFRWAEDWRFLMSVHHYIGLTVFPEITCSAGMFTGGHTDCSNDKDKAARRNVDIGRVSELGRALSHPDAYAHLYNEGWCRSHGIAPMRRR
jgi:glycosyltransferase involved in cell wall biosynthesis